jgi:hypothetical protein
MSATGRPELLEADLVAEATPVFSTALVPLATTVRWLPKMPLTRPDPGFVTQLIATAELAPQTRHLRRGTSVDARMAYGLRAGERRSVARRTRQII